MAASLSVTHNSFNGNRSSAKKYEGCRQMNAAGGNSVLKREGKRSSQAPQPAKAHHGTLLLDLSGGGVWKAIPQNPVTRGRQAGDDFWA